MLLTLSVFYVEKNLNLQKQIQCATSVVSFCYVQAVIVAFVSSKEKFVYMIELMENQIAMRESNYDRPIYKKTSADFDSFTTKSILFLHLILSFALYFIPISIVSYYNYFVSDLGEASFIAAVPSK